MEISLHCHRENCKRSFFFSFPFPLFSSTFPFLFSCLNLIQSFPFKSRERLSTSQSTISFGWDLSCTSPCSFFSSRSSTNILLVDLVLELKRFTMMETFLPVSTFPCYLLPWYKIAYFPSFPLHSIFFEEFQIEMLNFFFLLPLFSPHSKFR